MKRIVSVVLMLALLLSCTLIAPTGSVSAAVGQVTTGTLASSDLLNDLMEKYTSFVVVKHKQMGGSHYAYTEAVSDTYDSDAPSGQENDMFRPGSQLVLVELAKDGNNVKRTETVLLEDAGGVIRDPDVSEDGTKVLFSWKKAQKTDDFHLYEYDLITKETRQLTFGLGVADTEPKYLPNGNIVFSSSRIIQTVDCWKTPVSNLFICGPNGEDIVRVGYDQVHTTYPTVTDDGRVLYTRWDYNDRSQMYVQGVFQMFPDGTNQTELFGNNANFPTTLLHTRPVEGTSDQYISIATGHHTWQAGKLVILDTSKGRNDPDAVTLVFPDGQHSKATSVDAYGQNGPLFKYPYSISENQFLVSHAPNGWISNKASTPFGIYLMDTAGNKVELVPGSEAYPASQIVPITTRTLFERASMVNYASNTGTYYIGNVYEGDGLKDVPFGAAKYLRIVALDYRSYAIGDTNSNGWGTGDPFTPISTGNGSWDVKRVLGVVPIEEDGSALFKVPSETPVYFQVLDEEGQAIQSMRSWSTLMPGETFSCVGCHEDKNTVPPAVSTTTMAMAKGVQEIQPDLWMTGEGYEDYDPYEDSKGFSYLEEIQPIFDESCIECHSDQKAAFDAIKAYDMAGADTTLENDNSAATEEIEVIKNGSNWQYFKSNDVNAVAAGWNKPGFNGNWATAVAPFGDRYDKGSVTGWNDTTYIWIRQEFQIQNVEEFKTANAKINVFFDDNPIFYINGNQVYAPVDWVDNYTTVNLNNIGKYLVEGTNVFAIRCRNTTGGRMIDSNLVIEKTDVATATVFGRAEQWQYVIDAQPADNWMDLDYNASRWNTAKAGFGQGNGANTNWGGNDTQIWMRKEFNLTKNFLKELQGMKLILDIFYDQDPVVYLNGEKVFSTNGYNTAYQEITLSYRFTELLREGKNVLAVYCRNGEGGLYIDTGLNAVEFSGTPFSLEGRMMNSNQMAKAYPLSYLVLTASVPTSGNKEWRGSAENQYTNWISCMSQCEMLEPYQYGSAKSHLIEVLKDNHYDVGLTDAQLRKIMAWIDLAVPAYGDYAEGNTWNNHRIRWAAECDAKRAYYDTMNEMARQARALGAAAVEQDISITYKTGNTVYDDVMEFSGAKKLEIPTYYKAGDTVTVTLPEGEKYLGLTLDSLMGEAIIYAPNGTYTFTVPSDMQPYNRTFKNTNNKTITARVVGMDELNERHNLALNPYDLTDLNGSMKVSGYPHATTDSNCRNSGEFIVRNAIDGMATNKGHGGYPNQSWGPDLGSHWMQVDFGREVYVDEIVLAIRADFPHDTYFKTGTLEFSDGTKLAINIEKTADKQSFTFDPIKTSYVKLTNLVVEDINGDDWAGISEFEAYGTEQEVIEDTCDWDRDEDKEIMSGMAVGTTIDAFKAGFSRAPKVYQNGKEVASGVVGTGMTVEFLGVTYKLGVIADLDGDGAVNVADIMKLKSLIMADKWSELELFVGDLSESGKLDVADIMAIKNIIMAS